MSDQQKIYQAAIWLIPGIGDIHTKQLISYCGTSENVFRANLKKLIQIPGIGEKTAREILSGKSLKNAETLITKCEKSGVKMLHYTDPDYPVRLKQQLDAPAILFVKGNINLGNPRVISIVGTRRASVYGKKIVDEIVNGLAPHNPLIISGLAYGIDIQAHKAALAGNLPTVGVIAGGSDHIYPSSHKYIAEKMFQNGGIVAEHPPDTVPEAHHFPDRNRIIAGLSDLTIIVETAESGGAVITAEYANSYNREVMAVPGNIHVANSEGCNKLIRNHKAHIYTAVQDIEYLMNWDITDDKSVLSSLPEGLTDYEKIIIEVFRTNKNELLIDELSWKSNIPLNQLAGQLLNLEFRGILKSLPGKKFRIMI
jgi:DNA processing protein